MRLARAPEPWLQDSASAPSLGLDLNGLVPKFLLLSPAGMPQHLHSHESSLA